MRWELPLVIFCTVTGCLSNPAVNVGAKLVTYDRARSARLSRAWALYRLCHLQPRSPCRLDVFWCGFGRVVLFQIFLKDYGRSNGIHGGPGVLALALFLRGFCRTQEVAALFFEQSFGLPTGEALVDHSDGQVQLFAHARGKACGLLSHLAARAIEAQRQTDDNLSGTVLADKLAQPSHVLVAIDALQRGQWTRKSGIHFGNRQPNACATIVNPENGTGGLRGFLLWIDHKPQWTLFFEFPSASAAFPALPVAPLLHFFVEPGVFEEALHFRARKTLAKGLGTIGNAPDGYSGQRGVDLQLANIDFVEGVRRGVIIRQVVCLILLSDKSRNAFQEKVPIVRSDIAVQRVVRNIPGIERLQNLAQPIFDVSTPGERVAGHASDAGIVYNHGANFVQFGAMRQGVLPGTQQALLFAAEEDEANGAAWDKPRGFDGARGFNHQRGVAAVVQRARAQIPGIEMRAENHRFVGFFATANLANDVLLFDGPTDLVRHGEARPHFAWVCRHGARQAHGILASNDSLGKAFQLAIAGVGVAVEQHALARAHPENCGGARFQRAFNDAGWLGVFTEEVGPSPSKLRVRKQDGALRRRTGAREIVFAAVTDIDNVRFDSTGGCGRRPTLCYQAHGKLDRPEQLQPHCAFAPGHWQRVLLSVNVHSFGAERRDCPFHGLGHFRRARDAPADIIGQPAQVLLERGRTQDLRQNLCRRLRAGRFRSRAANGSLH